MSALLIALLATWVPATPPAALDASPPAATIPVDDVFLTLIADVAVPATETGVLVEVAATTGQIVKRGDLLARIDDSQARLKEMRAVTDVSRLRREAENDLKVKLAKKHRDAMAAELNRALETEKRLPQSVSQTEFDRLRLDVDQAELEIAQAAFDVEMAQLAVRAGEDDLRMAEMNVRRRKVVAPLDGVVVEVAQRLGEWVEAGQPVVRIVQLDRLRAEGLLSAELATANIKGRSVRVDVRFGDNRPESFAGQIVFVSPEIHPVNGKVLVYAEVENRAELLRPGLSVTMTIAP